MTTAVLKIECIGDDRFMSTSNRARYRLMGDPVGPVYWVAEITGRDARFGYGRKFLRGNRDYSRANSTGTRGIYAYFILREGRYYEASYRVTWGHRERYFCKVVNGAIVRVSESEVEQWVNNRWAQTFLRRLGVE